MERNTRKFGFEDVNIVPEEVTTIQNRSECAVDKFVFAAPMSSVVSLLNYDNFLDNNIVPVIPRSISFDERCLILNAISAGIEQYSECFVALSLKEAEEVFFNDPLYVNSDATVKICIDVANGHMWKLLDIIKSIKKVYKERVIIMAGNIANPETYRLYEEAGCDYVRCGIGGGSGCLTASNTGCFYPLFSLLKETYEIKKSIDGKCKIIADGGIRGYADIQKALLYADYVMLGGMLNKAIESAGKTIYGKSYFVTRGGRKILNIFRTIFEYGRIVPRRKYAKVMKRIKEGKLEVWKEFYGMSTKKAQKEMGNKKLKTSEGKEFRQKVEYDLAGFMENEISYLRSAMSYTNSHNLEEYKDSNWVAKISQGHNK